jgi:curved DNA-binding protein
MKHRDYYEILGLQRAATQDEIRRAYRKLARKYHPDVSKQADGEERFKELGEAYQVLKDPEKRAAYDRMGSQWQNGQDFQPPPNWDEGFEFSGASNDASADVHFSDFFEALFGGAREDGRSWRRGMHATGPDHDARMAKDQEDAYRGAQRPIPGQDHHAKVVIEGQHRPGTYIWKSPFGNIRVFASTGATSPSTGRWRPGRRRSARA